MKTLRRSLATLEVMLVSPAILFMVALFTRSIQPVQHEPSHTAQQIVDWYASSPHVGLWVLLIALPLSVLTLGTVTLVRDWRKDANLRDATRKAIGLIRGYAATLLIACTTAIALGILCIVAFHMMTE